MFKNTKQKPREARLTQNSPPSAARHLSKSGTARPDWSRLDCSLFETYPSPAAVCANTPTASSFTSVVVTYSSLLKVKANHNKHDVHKPQHTSILLTRQVRLGMGDDDDDNKNCVGERNRCNDWLRDRQAGDRIPATHPASHTTATWSFQAVKRPKCGVNHPPHVAPWLKKY